MSCKNVISIAFISASLCLLLGPPTIAQIRVDDIPLPTDVAELNGDSPDTFRLKRAIAIASAAATGNASQSTYKVILTAGTVEQGADGGLTMVDRIYFLNDTIEVPGSIVLASDGAGRQAADLRWSAVDGSALEDERAFIKFGGGFGGGLQNVRMTNAAGLSGDDNIRGLILDSVSSFTCENFRIDMSQLGDNSTGILVQRTGNQSTESLTVRDFNVSAVRPVVIKSGDNITISNFDLLCLDEKSSSTAKAIFQNENGHRPANLTIGPGTGQKGDHAVHFVGERTGTTAGVPGNLLTIQNFRWEQGNPNTGPAWVIDLERYFESNGARFFAIEDVVMINCRNSIPLTSTNPNVVNPNYVSRRIQWVDNLNFLGGTYHGLEEIANNNNVSGE